MSLNGRLGWALLVSLVLHVVFLGMGIRSLPVLQVAPPPSPLEMALSFDNPHDTGQRGSTAYEPPVLSSAIESSGTSVSSSRPVLPVQSPESPPSQEGDPGLAERSLQFAREEVAGTLSDQHTVELGSGTRDAVFASYEEAFGRKVEEVGSLNYPPPVNGQALHGSVRVTTTIKPDGSVAYVEVVHSSGSPELDAAARHIIRMAAPYQPFTKAMAERADLVSITRTFNFVQAGDVTGGE